MMNRRNFLKNSAFAGTAFLSAAQAGFSDTGRHGNHISGDPISRINRRLAIAMWDFSWILRHHRYGEFENWDQVLEGLSERGYSAIRIDAMPQFIVSFNDGSVKESYRCIKEGWKPSLWGNDFTTTIRPRESLLEFLPKCEKYGIRVGLATWFLPHGAGREDIFSEEEGLFRAWLETLNFLNEHGLLKNILYVDLLNEYPFWHGYDWLKKELDLRSDLDLFRLNNPEANIPDFENDPAGKFNPVQKDFYNHFATGLIRKLKSHFPEIDFFLSLDSGMKLADIDLSAYSALDYHIWFAHHGSIPGLNEIGSRDQSLDLKKIQDGLKSHWENNREMYIQWMDSRLQSISTTAARYGIPCGNTEGWGPISWFDHPELDWNWVKLSAEICIDLALKQDNYRFLCTSNFTHPQFRGIWEDIAWHKKITQRIRS
jgi:hypothetical protein